MDKLCYDAPKLHQLSILLSLILTGCASVDFDYPRDPSHAFADTNDTRLGQDIGDLGEIPPGYGGFHLLLNSIDALSTRLVLSAVAERSIDAQYYLAKADVVGYLSLRAMLAAADRGVRVRLLLDDFLTGGLGDGLLAMDSHPNVEVRLYNPFARRGFRLGDYITDFGRVNRRMHNKVFIVDNQAAIVGGRNIAEEYFGASEKANFGDLDALGVGPMVRDASTMFDEYWNHRLSVPITALSNRTPDVPALIDRANVVLDGVESGPYADALTNATFDYLKQGIDLNSWSPYQFVYDPPVKPDRTDEDADSILTPLRETASSAQNEIVIVSPYFVLPDDSIERMIETEQRGVNVRVLTNSLASNNHALVHSGYGPTRKRLLAGGVEILEVRPDATISGVADDAQSKATLHTKAFIVDRRWIYLGSFNWDPRSAYINTESGVILDDPLLAESLIRRINAAIPTATYRLFLDDRRRLRWRTQQDDGTDVIYTREPETSAWLRFRVWLMSLLPIKGQL